MGDCLIPTGNDRQLRFSLDECCRREGAPREVYAGYEDSVRTLMHYVDNFMTAPRNR